MKLTDRTIRAAKASDKSRKLSDGGGLFLQVQPNGAKLWRLAYRFDGKQRLLACGAYPGVGLSAARAARDAAKRLLNAGIDPNAQRKADKLAALVSRANTFRAVAEELLEKGERSNHAKRTRVKNSWLLSLAYSRLGDRPIKEITAPEILVVLREIEGRGNIETARRLRGIIGRVFRFAIATGNADRDPAADLRGALASRAATHRAAITDPKKFGGLLRAIDGYEAPIVRAAQCCSHGHTIG